MSITAIIGGQWGDEGKGKIVDLLSQDANMVARFQGGANAGHTVYKGNLKIVLHQVPSGILTVTQPFGYPSLLMNLLWSIPWAALLLSLFAIVASLASWSF